jgi:hypothetical protein
MAKDPALLFYTSEFMAETASMNNEERGQYIMIICQQHKFGHISESVMQRLCHGNAGEMVMSLLSVDSEGRYFVPRIDVEIERRAQHAEKQRENAFKRWNKDDADALPSQCDGIADAMPLITTTDTTTLTDTNTSTNSKQNNSSRAKKLNAADLIPASWNREEFNDLWAQFVQMRKEKRKPLTVVAIKRAIEKIQAEAGADWSKAKAVIEQTLERGWDGFFPVKAQEAAKQPARPSSDPAVEPDYWTKRFESKMEEQRKRLIKPQAQ